MRLRREIGGASIVLLLLTAAIVGVHGAVASGGVVASATGQGGVYVQNDELRTFAFTIKGADGSVQGEALFINRFSGVTAHADLNCLNVGHHAEGNVAVLSGIVTKSTSPIEGLTAVIAVQDRGEGANEPRDRMTFTLAVGSLTCNDFTPDPNALPLSDIDLGNIRVEG